MDSPLYLSRVTDGMRFAMAQQNLLDILRRLKEGEEALASGKRVRTLSDDPLASTRILNYTTALSRAEQWESNVKTAKQRLGHIDTVLGDLNDIVNRAREILISQRGAPATAETRANASVEVSQLLQEALNLANRSYEGRYLFSGTLTGTQPFATVGTYVLFQGNVDTWHLKVSAQELFSSSVSAAEALGARSAEIRGRADLSAALRPEVRVADLNGGRGVRLGEVLLSNGSETTTVDLSSCVDIQDVLDRFNATGLVTAALRSDRLGLQLTSPGGNISVLDPEGGHAAADLGIAQSNAGETLTGQQRTAALRPTTLLEDLRAGSGLDLTGLSITNGGTTVTVDLSGAETLNDLLRAINLAGAYVQAEINEDRNGINLVSMLNGAEFTVEEAGGQTASQLGLALDPEDLPLDRLNGGFGVSTNWGPDFTVTLHDGTTFSVDVSGAQTLAEVVSRINNAAENGGKLVARVTDEVKLVLEDSTTGSNDFSVEPVKGSFAAKHLGIESSTSESTLEGEALNPAGIRVDGLFNALVILRDALASNDEALLERVGPALDDAQQLLLDARADVGARINRLEMTEQALSSEKIRFQEALGEERDVDIAEAILAYQQDQLRLQAALSATGLIANRSLLDFLR